MTKWYMLTIPISSEKEFPVNYWAGDYSDKK